MDGREDLGRIVEERKEGLNRVESRYVENFETGEVSLRLTRLFAELFDEGVREGLPVVIDECERVEMELK